MPRSAAGRAACRIARRICAQTGWRRRMTDRLKRARHRIARRTSYLPGCRRRTARTSSWAYAAPIAAWSVSRATSCPAPQLFCRQPRAFGQGCELGPHDGGMHLAGRREAGEAAIGAGDNALAPHDLREPLDALRDRLGMLDKVRTMSDDAGDQRLPLRQPDPLPHSPFMLVPRIAGLEGIGAGVDPQHDVDDVPEFEVVYPRTHVDAVAGVIAHPLGRDAGERVVQQLHRGIRPIAPLRDVEFRMRRVVAR